MYKQKKNPPNNASVLSNISNRLDVMQEELKAGKLKNPIIF